ncbi:MAG: c-type cytochrome [Deltaproteobacteria bacterium]|nr:c-type cytochrome [Deltaproteobacteria bacterium]
MKRQRIAYSLVFLFIMAVFSQNLVFAGESAKIPPPPLKYPQGELGNMVKLGEKLVMETNTQPLTKAYVGNDLKCTSCHLEGGKKPNRGSTFIGTAANFPAKGPREKTILTLQDRILNCFMRSMGGTRPPVGSKPAIAMTAYITWLSKGLPLSMLPDKPVSLFNRPFPNKAIKPFVKKADLKKGAALYKKRCVVCHGSNGQGDGDENPPLWGSRSYNKGAGLANNLKLATWLQYNMPLGDENLTNREAADIARFVNSHKRIGFNLRKRLPEASKMGVYNGQVK